MRKNIVLLITIAVLIVGSGCVFFRFLPVPYENLSVETREPLNITLEPIQEQFVTPTPPASPIQVPTLTTREISREGESPRYIVQVRYPQIETANRQASLFNHQIEQMMNEFVDSFIYEIQSHEYDEFQSEFTNGLTADYRPTYIDSKQVSITFLQSIYYAGAAHPLPFSRSINYDLRRDRIISLDELFVGGADYLPRLSAYVLTDLRQQGVLEWEEGASPSPENFNSWNVTLEGLLFTFDPYQVASYAAGFQEVLVPYEAVRDILRDGGPVPPLDFK
jgi:hypothetical protein